MSNWQKSVPERLRQLNVWKGLISSVQYWPRKLQSYIEIVDCGQRWENILASNTDSNYQLAE